MSRDDEPSDEAREVAALLLNGPAVAVASVSPGTLPSGPGLYAWWTTTPLRPEVTHPASGPCVREDGLQLIYIGLSKDLDGRVNDDHLGRQTGSSTLRRALGAWCGVEHGWVTRQRGGRVQHEPSSELGLTSWIRENLAITWATHDQPDAVERGARTPPAVDPAGRYCRAPNCSTSPSCRPGPRRTWPVCC